MSELPDLDFVLDELLFETHAETYRGGERFIALRDALMEHAGRGSSLDEAVPRLVKAFGDAHERAKAAIAEPLCEHILRTQALQTVVGLQESPELLSYLLRIAAGKPYATTTSDTMVRTFLETVGLTGDARVNQSLASFATRVGKRGRDISVLVPWLREELSAEAVGRGAKRVDPGGAAASALAVHLASGDYPELRGTLVALSEKKGTLGKNAKRALGCV